MDAVIYTKSIPEYEMLSGILADELSDVTVSRGVIDREYHLEREYDVVVVGINGAQGMELVCKYRELYGNTLVIWITDDPYFARVAIRTHSALVNQNWTLKLYFFTYNLPLLYSRICFPVLPGCKISQRICRPFFVEKFYICSHFFLNIFSPQVKISK